MAAIATFALKPGVWFRRVRLVIVSPDSQRTACLLSGRNSTYRPVQISGTGSHMCISHVAFREARMAGGWIVPVRQGPVGDLRQFPLFQVGVNCITMAFSRIQLWCTEDNDRINAVEGFRILGCQAFENPTHVVAASRESVEPSDIVVLLQEPCDSLVGLWAAVGLRLTRYIQHDRLEAYSYRELPRRNHMQRSDRPRRVRHPVLGDIAYEFLRRGISMARSGRISPQDDHLSHLSPPGDGSNSVPVPVRRNLAKGRPWLVSGQRSCTGSIAVSTTPAAGSGRRGRRLAGATGRQSGRAPRRLRGGK